MVIGKHSGSHGLQDRLGKLGITLARHELDRFLTQVRSLAQGKKRHLDDEDLMRLYRDGLKVA